MLTRFGKVAVAAICLTLLLFHISIAVIEIINQKPAGYIVADFFSIITPITIVIVIIYDEIISELLFIKIFGWLFTNGIIIIILVIIAFNENPIIILKIGLYAVEMFGIIVSIYYYRYIKNKQSEETENLVY